jgi:putative DNA primase/helicase
MIATANTLEREALAAVDRGWALTPVRGKIPVRRGWQAESPADRETVIRWSREYDGLGVRTGQASDVVVIDLDFDSLPPWLPPTVTACTPRGGHHLYYALPEGAEITNTTDSARKFDIRGTGGQVVSVGSTRDDGRQYKWLAGHSPDAVALATLPARTNAAITSFIRNCFDLANAQPGGRNHALNTASFKLGQYAANGDLDRAAAEWSLTQAARQCGLGDDEITKTLASGLSAGMSNTSSATLATLKIATSQPPAPRLSIASAEGATTQTGAPRRYQLTDVGNSKRLIDMHGNRLLHVAKIGWYIYDGTRFSADEEREILELGKQLSDAMWSDARHFADVDANYAHALRKHAAASQSRARIESAISLAASDPRVSCRARDLDSDPWLLNTTSGTIDLRTGQIRKHDPADRLTKATAAPFVSDATAPRWNQFLREVFSADLDLIKYVQTLCGLALAGETVQHVLPMCSGPGGNGKSVFLNAIRNTLGDYAIIGAPDLLLQKNGGEHPTSTADLMGARVVVIEEMPVGGRFAAERVKALTGSQMVKARLMRQDYFQFPVSWTFWLATNFRPSASCDDDGFWRRLKEIPFQVTFAPDEQDPLLNQKLETESAGILNWMLAGCRMWQEQDYAISEPDAVSVSTDEYRQSTDQFSLWLAECTEDRDGADTDASTLFRSYCEYCRETGGTNPLGRRRFGETMKRRGYISYKNSVTYYRGIVLI